MGCAAVLGTHVVYASVRVWSSPRLPGGLFPSQHRRRSIVFRVLLQQANKQTNKQTAVLIRIPNIKQKQMSLFCYPDNIFWISFHSEPFPRKQKQKHVCTSHKWKCDHLWHLWPQCDQTCFAKKTGKKQRNKFGHKFKFMTVCDRHKCHKLVTHSVWLVQTCLCLCLKIRIRTTLIPPLPQSGTWRSELDLVCSRPASKHSLVGAGNASRTAAARSLPATFKFRILRKTWWNPEKYLSLDFWLQESNPSRVVRNTSINR